MANVIGTLFGSPRAQRRLFWLSAGVLVVGVAAFLAFVVFRGTGNAFPDKFSNKPAQLATPEKHVPITKAQLTLARKFMSTAVLRKNLDASYDIVNVDLKGRLTRKQWDTGNIPVIDYPAGNIDTAKFQVDYSYQNEALLEVDLISKANSGVRPELLFFLGLKRAGAKETGPWQVSYWEPHWKPPVPEAPN
jgi:hypothetical protein